MQVGEDGKVSGRNLHEFLEVKERYTQWFARQCDYGFAENVDFAVIPIFGNDDTAFGGKRKHHDHRLTVSMAKEISMIQRTEQGKLARQYFIKCEEKLAQIAQQNSLDTAQLSPQMRMIMEMANGMAQQELRSKEIEARLQITQQETAEVKQSLEVIKDTILQRDEDWRRDINKMFNHAVASSGTKDFQAMRRESYETLESRARCRLGVQLTNLKARMSEAGVAKSKIAAATKLDVIENNVRLKEIYTQIVKEFVIRYSA